MEGTHVRELYTFKEELSFYGRENEETGRKQDLIAQRGRIGEIWYTLVYNG
jgi:hypothetical protein